MLSNFIFAVVFISLGILSKMYVTDPIIHKANASKDWPTVEGNIVDSKVGWYSDPDGKMYIAEIKYNYIVNGKSYSTNKISAVQSSSSLKSTAKSLVAKYPTGSTVLVHYDPKSPSNALLEPGISGLIDHILLYIPIILIGAGALMLVLMFND